ncbi:DeoR faimly transcriptional regulator [Dehalococcoides mccartyi]|uniref:DeoR faimly transcriptional regulator n=1 Tax=Dehalococcoides mccartyi TaxID=61435 RepID=A0A0V8LYC0_9CHLR|nr:alpha/beta hydrolase [Dehalococcoides mccartyi]KSV16432.1 DeoR faimly transcriptional regulator [Dehalococcoides mccartyi]
MQIYEKTINVVIGTTKLPGELAVPPEPIGLVIFVHGSGSNRQSPRNRQVAHQLNSYGLATFLFDLLTPQEDMVDILIANTRYNFRFLADRVIKVTEMLKDREETKDLPLGYFGASTGAAAALYASSLLPGQIKAVVSRGGRPDLARELLPMVESPTLFIVGEKDTQVLKLNTQAQKIMRAPNHLCILPGASHLFEEPGALEKVAELAGGWFIEYMEKTA